AGIGLAVLGDDLDLKSLAAGGNVLVEDLFDLAEDVGIGLAEAGERTGARANMADLDDATLSMGRNDPQHRRRRNRAEAGRDHAAPGRPGVCACHEILPENFTLSCAQS